MSKLTITLTVDDTEADALLELLARGLTQTTYSPSLRQSGARVQEYVEKRVDDARIRRGRKVLREAK